MTTLISITLIVILVIALALVVPVIRRKNREANVARAEQLRSEAATSAQTVLPPAQARAAETEANAAEARAVAERAEAEAQQARLAASQAEAAHEDQIRAADRLDPRVDHYAPQVPGTADVGPTPPAEVHAEPAPATHAEDTPVEEPAAQEPAAQETTTEQAPATGAPLLPRRTPGANEMPGRPMESEGGGGWFTRKDSTDS